MFYNAPARGDDGLYFVKACNDEKRKCLVQLNGVTVSEVSGEMIFDLNSEVNTKKGNRHRKYEPFRRTRELC